MGVNSFGRDAVCAKKLDRHAEKIVMRSLGVKGVIDLLDSVLVEEMKLGRFS